MIGKIIYSLALLIYSSLNTSVFAQTYVPPAPGQDWSTGGTAQLSQGTGSTTQTSLCVYDSDGRTTLAQEQAEQCTDAVAQNIECRLWSGLYWYAHDYEDLYVHNCSDFASSNGLDSALVDAWLHSFILEVKEFGAKVATFLTANLPDPSVAECLFRPSWFQFLFFQPIIIGTLIYVFWEKIKIRQISRLDGNNHTDRY